MEFKFSNVNEAFHHMVRGIQNKDIQVKLNLSRVGSVLSITEPVLITYENPWERVLFNPARDCNPFFHLYESLWMLAGRNDVKSLAWYNSKIGTIASDDGITFNGAYGYRWRSCTRYDTKADCSPGDIPWIEHDQLEILIDHLQENPESRRAVLQMWNVEDDLLKVSSSLDVCCNLCVCFRIVDSKLDMTVFNRSNDLIWGMMGANVVHFSYLQEYIALSLGIPVGNYHTCSNDVHVYLDNWKPEEWLSVLKNRNAFSPMLNYDASIPRIPLFNPLGPSYPEEKVLFDRELLEIVGHDFTDTPGKFETLFFAKVAAPMFRAYAMYKMKDYEAAYESLKIYGVRDAYRTHGRESRVDWHIAGRKWIEKRCQNK